MRRRRPVRVRIPAQRRARRTRTRGTRARRRRARSTTSRPRSPIRSTGCTAICSDSFPYPVRITIADNASIDDTPRIAAELAAELDDVRVVRLEQKGRGRALHQVWADSDAQVLAYMDVDLSTDLAALAPLVAPLISGHSDLAIGTRLGPRLTGGARRQAGVHLALLQPDPEVDARRPVLRRAVRVQGDPRRRRASGCCRTSPTPAGSSTPNCWCWPSAAGCASTRCRSTGSTTPTAGWTSSRRRPPTSRASDGCCAGSPTVRSR